MERLSLDNYVVDGFVPDLVGHDRRPAAFIVYLFLLRLSIRTRRETLAARRLALGREQEITVRLWLESG